MDLIEFTRPVEKADIRYAPLNKQYHEWWTWIDGLYMAPPSMARMSAVTGDDRYLNYAAEMWWETSDFLYSEEDSLWFRDQTYITALSDNGKKIFWGRGIGWGIAGLARMLEFVPQDHKHRAKFENQFQTITTRLLGLQHEDGLWRVSLLDPEFQNEGETSGSVFFFRYCQF